MVLRSCVEDIYPEEPRPITVDTTNDVILIELEYKREPSPATVDCRAIELV
jgi:hypothetical protein